jgi:hypothetical protein
MSLRSKPLGTVYLVILSAPVASRSPRGRAHGFSERLLTDFLRWNLDLLPAASATTTSATA